MKKKLLNALLAISIFTFGCEDDDDPAVQLTIPTSYSSTSFAANTTAENTVVTELGVMTSAANDAEANAQGATPVADISYPSNLSAVTLPGYRTKVQDWLVELVKSANDDDAFQNPGSGTPAIDEEGGLLGTRLLDENGLELEQMVQKGSFGAALYNHALSVIEGDLSNSSAIDKLVAIHGTDASFNPETATAAATYSVRRSNQLTETGFFYDIKTALITAKAAIEGGSAFNAERDQAIADYLMAWEKSNFATVIFYCNSTKTQLQNAGSDEAALGDALHAYAEGVAFAHGFKGVSNKLITDSQIDSILELLLAPDGETPESYRFLNEANLIANLDQIIDDIQTIYGFTDAEVNTFFVNNPE
ncbi:hypothetical protein [Fulvivirga lutea]|uniref:DUF4856 domain-containing protein n=1 Tax=Fulvivirga lutea TaxID=2810512 RepID=A0A974ZZH3_9BACT|nr:hypothetical protein [Fulvivirga lutea]QSE96204.1 hypothetical protein JR347_11335 [Fulvivirga lutea]